jgi:hypothetical protein
MAGLVSLISAARAYAAERITENCEAAETAVGILLVGGFGLLGTVLPVLL